MTHVQDAIKTIVNEGHNSDGLFKYFGGGGTILDPDTTLFYDFATDKSLIDQISGIVLTWTRASNAAFYDELGILKVTTANSARFDHNPATMESLGLLHEGERENLLVQSNDFSDALYDKRNITINQNITGPDNMANSAWEFTDDAALLEHAVRQIDIFPAVDNRRPSVYVQGGTARYATFATRFYNSVPTSRGSVFDTQAGIFTAEGGDYSDFIVQQLPNNWWRISMTAQNVNTAYNDWFCGISGGPDHNDMVYSAGVPWYAV